MPESDASEGADRVGGQLRGDKEYPFGDVTNSGRIWRKMPKSGARSVTRTVNFSLTDAFGQGAEGQRLVSLG